MRTCQAHLVLGPLFFLLLILFLTRHIDPRKGEHLQKNANTNLLKKKTHTHTAATTATANNASHLPSAPCACSVHAPTRRHISHTYLLVPLWDMPIHRCHKIPDTNTHTHTHLQAVTRTPSSLALYLILVCLTLIHYPCVAVIFFLIHLDFPGKVGQASRSFQPVPPLPPFTPPPRLTPTSTLYPLNTPTPMSFLRTVQKVTKAQTDYITTLLSLSLSLSLSPSLFLFLHHTQTSNNHPPPLSFSFPHSFTFLFPWDLLDTQQEKNKYPPHIIPFLRSISPPLPCF